MVYLENRRWTFCNACQRLHPSREFGFYDLSSSPQKSESHLWAGIVDICLCTFLTMRGRKHIIEHLKKTTK